MKILISSCLIGKKCRYDGCSRTIPGVAKLLKEYTLIDICPEIEGKLSCPRDKNEILKGNGKDVLSGKAKVVSIKGQDNTKNFVEGAIKALDLAFEHKATVALLKSKSPSCGKYEVYNGCFNGVLRKGSGVTAQLLLQNKIRVYTEDEIYKIDFKESSLNE